MDRSDIRAFRQWHLAAARRARAAGFDIVYVYPTHGYLMWEFLSRSRNDRTDEYGGSLENRARLLREVLEDTRAAVGDRCAIAVRCSADGHGDEHLSAAEAHDLIGMLDDLTDLWDLVVGDYYGEEMATSRFVHEAALEERIARAKRLTRKPVVSVGRFTSPDTMVRQLRTGVLDLIGAARPSIADPFLPSKIREGRLEEIRECIGCNVCYASNYRGAALRCTQNPTMGEEWRRGWHPERVPPGKGGTVLIVGAGPAGLEAAHILGKRGYSVTLADAASEPGGRVTLESRLPGLAEWARVRDYRLTQLRSMPQVSMYLGNRLAAEEVREFGADHVLIATGARWRRDGLGRWHSLAIEGLPARTTLTPDDIMRGARPEGEVTIFDDDHYYMAPVIAVQLARGGANVSYVTTTGSVSEWSHYTGEQERTQQQLLELGVRIQVSTAVVGFDGESVGLACVYTGREWRQRASTLVLVTSREPSDELYRELVGEEGAVPDLKIQRIGDCLAPALIAHAVFSGHKAARGLDEAGEPAPAGRDRSVVPATERPTASR
jgi:dimethylamine/trimethylamine dehydrogenase